ncbi:uncharacterized protein NPIL_525841 [Nephila pilipes]|uniref:Monocarboxylate transporter 9 n=1 Tax=Nephila pilipes TaxID=299642 RepID=A0A8X6U8L5_NEPPI|nr:uncharacterized protein NPIL_525841 [Nephila pilipes]
MTRTGPVAGIFGQKYGLQGVMIAGGITASVTTALCFFASDIVWITVLWGVLSAIGAALTMVQIQVVVGQYFKKYRTTAGGMVFSGACAGSFLFPPLVEWLVKDYGIEGTFLIIAGLVMHTIPATMILRKPSWLRAASQKRKDYSVKDANGINYTSGSIPDVQCLRSNNKLVLKLLDLDIDNSNDTSLEKYEKDLGVVEKYEYISEVLEDMYASFQLSSTKEFYENPAFSKENVDIVPQKEKTVACIPTIQRYDLQKASKWKSSESSNWIWKKKRTSISNVSSTANVESKHYILLKIKTLLDMDPKQATDLFPDENSVLVQKNMAELGKLYNWFHLESQNVDPPEVERSVEKSNSFQNHIKRTLRLFGDPVYLLICLSRCIHFLIFVPFLTIIVDFTIDRGFREDEGSYVIAAVSFGDLIGRLCLGWVTDRGYLNLSQYMLVGLLAQGLNTASLPLMPTKAAIYTSLSIFGMLQGSLFVRHPVLVQKYMGSNVQSIAMGCMNFFPGLLGFTFPIYIGYFRDTLGTYDPIFYINGAAAALVGLLWILESQLQRCRAET